MSSSLPSPTPMAKRLEGKVAVITGGARAIGECTARLFCWHGAKVVIADILDELGLSVCRDIGSDVATYIHCDVTEESDVRAAVDLAVDKYGKLDIMFNNAAIIDPKKPSILETEQADFERAISVNLTGVFLGTKHAARVMMPAGQGSIIFNASVGSVIGGVASHAYIASKHAIVGLAKNAAVELGRFGIRVNCVSPFLVSSPGACDFFQMKECEVTRMVSGLANLKGVVLEEEDVAEAALYLASDESRYVSGHNLVLDGAYTVAKPSFGLFKSEPVP